MATITQQIPNYHGGISQQADEVKAPGQVNKLKNAIPDVVQGLTKRPGTELLKQDLVSLNRDKWFHYYRDENERYIGRLDLSSGVIQMWDKDGTEKTVVYDSTDEAAIKKYLTTDENPPMTIQDTDDGLATNIVGFTDKIAITIDYSRDTFYEDGHGLTTGDPVRFNQNNHAIGNLTDGTIYYVYVHDEYTFGLATTLHNANIGTLITYVDGDDDNLSCTFDTFTAAEDELQTLTINDYTYLTNRNKTVLMDTAATASLNPVRPPEAYIELKKVAYARQYAVNLFDDNTTQTVKTATRISIASSNLNTADSSCPNVGTEIFNVGTGDDYAEDIKQKFTFKNVSKGNDSALYFFDNDTSGRDYSFVYCPPPWTATTYYRTNDLVTGKGDNSQIYKRTGAAITGGSLPAHDETGGDGDGAALNGWTWIPTTTYSANSNEQSTQIYHGDACIELVADGVNAPSTDATTIDIFEALRGVNTNGSDNNTYLASGVSGAERRTDYANLPFIIADENNISGSPNTVDFNIIWKHVGDYSDQHSRIIFRRTNDNTQTIGGNTTFSEPNSALKTDVGEILISKYGWDSTINVLAAGRSDLYFRLTTTGQAVPNTDATEYTCRYTTTIDLLHGGSGWEPGDQIRVRMKDGTHVIQVDKTSIAKEQANLALVRPTPTSFDTKTTVTAESIIGSIRQAVVDAGNFTESEVTQVGNGLYINRGSAQTLGTITDETSGLQFNITNHGFITGRNIRYTFTGTVLPSLTNNTNYWVIKNDNNSFWLATSYANAIAGTKIDHTGAIPAGSTHTFTPEKFGISTSDTDLLNVFTNEIQDVADLPSQCKHDYKLKVRNSEEEADDYYLKFIGQEKADGTFLDGKGIWEECAEPGRHVRLDYSTMPVGLIRTADGNFRVTRFDGGSYTVNSVNYDVPTWADCTVGSWDSTTETGTVPEPSFVGYTINKVISFRNRLGILSDENVNLSRPGSFFDFWAISAIAYAAGDNIDVSCSSTHPAILYDALQINAGLLLFSENEQFMLTTDSDVLSPLTAKVNSFCTYNFNKNTKPISLGTTVGFLDNASKYSRFFEISNLLREGQPEVFEQSKIVSQLLPKDLTLITNSRENSTIFFAERGSHTIYGLRYLKGGDRRLQQAWFTWEMTGTVEYMALMDEELYLILRDSTGAADAANQTYKDNIERITLRLSDSVASIDKDNDTIITNDDIAYPIHLDCYKKITNIHANSSNTRININHLNANRVAIDATKAADSTTITITRNNHSLKVGKKIYITGLGTGDNLIEGEFVIQTATTNTFTVETEAGNTKTFSDDAGFYSPIIGVVAVPTGETKTYNGLYAKSKHIIADEDRIPGNKWRTPNTDTYDVYVGYLFDMEVEFPTIYPVKTANNNIIADYTGGLVVHRVELNLGQNGIYEVELERGMWNPTNSTRDKTTYSESIGPLTSDTPPVVATDYYSAAYVMPLKEEGKQVIPIYEKNKNLTLTFKSTSPSPATLYSMTWEGDYTNNHYERV